MLIILIIIIFGPLADLLWAPLYLANNIHIIHYLVWQLINKLVFFCISCTKYGLLIIFINYFSYAIIYRVKEGPTLHGLGTSAVGQRCRDEDVALVVYS